MLYSFLLQLSLVAAASVRAELGSESVANSAQSAVTAAVAQSEAQVSAEQVQAVLKLKAQHSVVSAKTGVGAAPTPGHFGRYGAGDYLYAYVMKYLMGSQWGVEIVHTSMVFCPSSQHRRDDYAAKAERCKNTWFGSCWIPNRILERKLDDHDPAKERVVRTQLVDATCYEVGFFVESTPREPAGILAYKNPAFEYAGDSNPEIYSMGPVNGAQVDQAIARTMECRADGAGKRMDFNPYTYDYLGHNCHHHTDAMLLQLGLPKWSESKHLPAAFMPEDGSKNLLLSLAVEKFVGEPQTRRSPTCDRYERDLAAKRAAEAAKEEGRACFGIGDLFNGCGGRDSRSSD